MSFPAARWADAFLSAAGPDYEAGLQILQGLASISLTRREHIVGKGQASNLIDRLAGVLTPLGFPREQRGVAAAYALLYFMVLRGYIIFLPLLVKEIEHALNVKQGILEVKLEAAEKPSSRFLEDLKTAFKKAVQVNGVQFDIHVMPELIAGYRFTTGSNRQDYSLLGNLKQLEAKLKGWKQSV